jgi:hypothetical protein
MEVAGVIGANSSSSLSSSSSARDAQDPAVIPTQRSGILPELVPSEAADVSVTSPTTSQQLRNPDEITSLRGTAAPSVVPLGTSFTAAVPWSTSSVGGAKMAVDVAGRGWELKPEESGSRDVGS